MGTGRREREVIDCIFHSIIIIPFPRLGASQLLLFAILLLEDKPVLDNADIPIPSMVRACSSVCALGKVYAIMVCHRIMSHTGTKIAGRSPCWVSADIENQKHVGGLLACHARSSCANCGIL
jgi:hypothetical protein